ncbi:exonuclease domain-containing protein [Asticcacaulis sp. DXS10W]|uniref:Exonuclease domain-containing protein n=1 Tax=Asticcacaulis currens TaxID=2984210 RepID=A0ABT5IAJ7_9CAUL|nr:exonuclease domain-containing protein [Asticcacaulis currens]MDC7693199.1 exonuclease domain-containing protein [Asticcacaulis currens]
MSRFPVLPPTYYHAHFSEMLAFVREVYATVLGESEHAFIAAFEGLTLEAQCLFIRMSNRKRPVFSVADLVYAEISEIEWRLEELAESGFARHASAADYRAWLDTLTRPMLEQIARDHDIAVSRQWSKAQVARAVEAGLPFDDFSAAFSHTTWVPGHRETVAFLLYLYFGKLSDNLTAFTLRDLGVVSVRGQAAYQARFISREEALGGHAYTQALKSLKSATPEDYQRLAEQAGLLPEATTPFVEGLRDRLMHDLGRFFERQKDTDQAIGFYAQSGLFESQERTIRLLHGRGETERVLALLESMLDAPAHDEAFLFADDFYRRKFGKKRTSAFTDLLRDGEEISADDLYRGLPELAAIRHYEAQGWTAYHVENGLWPALFGLLFWDELFEQPGSLASEFDWMPQALKDNRFAALFPHVVAERLAALETGRSWPLIAATLARCEGRENGVFGWWPGLGDLMHDFLNVAPSKAVRDIIAGLCSDFQSLRDGFPDLLLIGPDSVRFIEVKAEGDQVRRHQLARLNLLRQAGFEAGIVRVAFRPDPDQVYTVVDIETTGGQAAYERVTEIGAVKIRNGEIIDTWQSLINPERRIPAFITELTGISNEMVRDAPRFVDIADAFDAFLKGTVFVAHNVNFDYGFLSAEYRRLERPFRYPKLCTVASMRRHFPGLAAYGLAPLSREFGIELKNHHRALSDAMAAAELLKMVNEKRLSAVTAS